MSRPLRCAGGGTVAAVDFAATVALRREHLRPASTDAELAARYDAPDAVHLGITVGRQLVGVATALPAPLAEDAAAWRVRGVVTREGWRSQGYGAALMQALLAAVTARGGRTVWLTARPAAEPFYARLGFHRHGEPYIDPEVGPHVAMRRSPATPVRVARDDDAAAIAGIYSREVLTSVASFEEVPPSEAEMLRRMRSEPRLPWLVAVGEGGRVLGYAYAKQHAARASYRWSVDVAVYLDAGARGRGVGRGLYDVLLPLLTELGYVNVFAGVTLPNPASVALHTAVGFEPVGVHRATGFRSGAWRDVGWWQRHLLDPPADPAEPRLWAPG